MITSKFITDRLTILQKLRVLLLSIFWGIGVGFVKFFSSQEINGQPPKILSSWIPQGFIFGKKYGRYLVKPDEKDGHILVIGGAGSGKSSCLGIPSVLSTSQRIFAIDIKGEIYTKAITKRPNIKVLNPANASSPGYNPFFALHQSRNPTQEAREIAQAIIPPPTGQDPFWSEGAANILTGAILHFFVLGYHFIQTIEAIQSTPIIELIEVIRTSQTREATFFVNQFAGMDIKTLAGVYAELSNKIMVFATDPDIKACLSKKQVITPEDLENGFDIFLNIPEDKLEQWKGFLTLIINQQIKHFERRSEKGAPRVLFLLDEFPRLGKISIINALATLRSKNITFCLMVQSLAQLDAIYGRFNRQIIADNCPYKAILNATDAETQDYFSRLVGTYESRKTSTSKSFEQESELIRSTGINETTEERRIIKPEDFATLQDIVLLSPYGFFRARKTPYYANHSFSC